MSKSKDNRAKQISTNKKNYDKSLDNYYWYLDDDALNFMQEAESLQTKCIGVNSMWDNGPDDNWEYQCIKPLLKLHIHYKSGTHKIYKIHIKNSNNSCKDIAKWSKKCEPNTPGELAYLLKDKFPNHAKLFQLVKETYEPTTDKELNTIGNCHIGDES